MPNKCDCGLEAKRKQVKKTGPNTGRWFFTCPKEVGKQCNYFLWETREPISEVEMSSRQYETIMRSFVVLNENLKVISAKLFKKGYIPVWESEDKDGGAIVQEPVLDAPVTRQNQPESTEAPKEDIDKVNKELAGEEDEEDKPLDLSQIPF